jgi:type IV pilus assembly protein PilM
LATYRWLLHPSFPAANKQDFFGIQMRLFSRQRVTPIGVDIGSRSIKLVQYSADHSKLIDMARWDLPVDSEPSSPEEHSQRLIEGIQRAREGREFQGKNVVVCLNDRQLFLQNVRVPKGDTATIDRTVQQEVAGRIPFPVAETEIRYVEAADIRQGDQVMREVILMACHRPILERTLAMIDKAGLSPAAVDVEPLAVLRSYAAQFRRDEDRHIRSLIVHIGYVSTLVMIAQGEELLFVKYVELGGRHFDEGVARSLKMDLREASALRRHNGDRRTDRQDPEIARSINEATRPNVDRLANELAMCVRYHSVTFRGQPLERLVLGGGEATTSLIESLDKRLGLKGEMSDPFRPYETATHRGGRVGQWDVASGLALRPCQAL